MPLQRMRKINDRVSRRAAAVLEERTEGVHACDVLAVLEEAVGVDGVDAGDDVVEGVAAF